MAGGERDRLGGHPPRWSYHLFICLRALYDDSVNGGDEDRVGIVVRQRLWLLRRKVARFGRGKLVIVVMMTAGSVVMLAVVVVSRSRVRMEVRTKIVSGGLATAVGMAKGG